MCILECCNFEKIFNINLLIQCVSQKFVNRKILVKVFTFFFQILKFLCSLLLSPIIQECFCSAFCLVVETNYEMNLNKSINGKESNENNARYFNNSEREFWL